jgi:hypothetical protein
MVTMADRRRHVRNRIDWPVSVYHPRLGMFINGRSVNVSQSGAMLSLPIAVPIRPGQVVELNFPRTTTLAKMAGSFSRIKTALVVRVEAEQSEAEQAEAAANAPHFAKMDGTLSAAPALLTAPAKLKRPVRQTVAVHFDKNALSLAR